MKLKIFLLLTLSLLLTDGISAKKRADGKALVNFPEMVYDFGNIREADGSVTHEFEFVNQGNGNLVILDAKAECGCTRPVVPTAPVSPGKKGKVKVTYNPAGRPGTFTKDITVRTNGEPKKIRLRIKGNVIPK